MEEPSKSATRRNGDQDIITPTLKSTSTSGGKKRGQQSSAATASTNSTILSIDSSDCSIHSIGTNARNRGVGSLNGIGGGGSSNISSAAAAIKKAATAEADKDQLSLGIQKLKDSTSFVMPRKQHLETPMDPSKCPLFCVFYAEFDYEKGAVVKYQSPEKFMDHDIELSNDSIHDILSAEFQRLEGPWEIGNKKEGVSEPTVKPDSASIFDSTSEYIIAGDELASQLITVSTHEFHIMSRPTIIESNFYGRRTLLFSVGFVIRRGRDSMPFKPILTQLASTLKVMEEESKFLSYHSKHVQDIFDAVLPSLNSDKMSCHLLLDEFTSLHLKYFPLPKAHAPPVPDYVVPILLKQDLGDMDLSMGWLRYHINGLRYVKLITESSKVNEGIVRAALRVMRHHKFLACVDIFMYSNIYESTEKAQRMLLGELDELLEKAFDWVAYQETTDSNSSIGTSEALLGFEGTSLKSTPGSHHGLVVPPGEMGRSLQIGRVLIPPQQGGSMILGLESSSYPSSRSQIRSMDGVADRLKTHPQAHMSHPKSYRLSGSPPSSTQEGSPPTGTGSSPSSHSSSAPHYCTPSNTNGFRPPPKKVPSINLKHRQMLKAALASYYSSFSRDKSLKDMLISKMKECVKNAGDASDYSTRDDTDDDDRSIDVDYIPNGLLDKPKKKLSVKQRALSICTVESAPETAALGTIDIDFQEAFDFFSPRRMVTFGVIHGLIHRVHEYPMAFGEGIEPPKDIMNKIHRVVSSKARPPKRQVSTASSVNSIGKDVHSPDSSIRGQTPRRGNQQHMGRTPQRFASHSGRHGTTPINEYELKEEEKKKKQKFEEQKKFIEERKKREEIRLAFRAAASMDGTKCDDELYSMYQVPLSKLKAIVQKHTKKDILSVYSTNTVLDSDFSKQE